MNYPLPWDRMASAGVDRTPHYVIRGGVEGRERLRVLARVMWPTTRALLGRVGIARNARCLDVGCGGGDVTRALAQLVPEGSVVGLDLDETKLELARKEAADAGIANIEFRTEDVMLPPCRGELFDVAYVRFLLTHLPNPAGALANVVRRIVPGGILIVEDIDFTGHFCEPESPAFTRYLDVYTAAAKARGCDPYIGPRLPGLLRDAGVVAHGMNVVQPAGFEGEVKLIAPITLENVADAVVGTGLITYEELDQTVAELYRFAHTEGTIMSMPRVVQAWGRLDP
jgi:SAM-dependent methyltransferase